ncbi:MAG: hypothetical protein HC875_19155 [Anaerolineales bacterium]|nr:hypothetical protein [Anaerolineales bacterium]
MPHIRKIIGAKTKMNKNGSTKKWDDRLFRAIKTLTKVSPVELTNADFARLLKVPASTICMRIRDVEAYEDNAQSLSDLEQEKGEALMALREVSELCRIALKKDEESKTKLINDGN